MKVDEKPPSPVDIDARRVSSTGAVARRLANNRTSAGGSNRVCPVRAPMLGRLRHVSAAIRKQVIAV